jgi:hypothetical protein
MATVIATVVVVVMVVFTVVVFLMTMVVTVVVVAVAAFMTSGHFLLEFFFNYHVLEKKNAQHRARILFFFPKDSCEPLPT